ncbi:Type IV secretory pathway VirD4 protein-like protein [Xanthobacter versatilis]|uniref:Type IV secretory pathway VirD4 protein-like protein n=1 Tax=Xanthobacter autotrophicus (strain ATCC BAA-1158 / Py2) TaxID=78245 RepID=A7IBV8_XANP2|nr:Type IV secretory pathway VirD4 protein-like protein [Xanthobacter autotrophicus Py2]
MAKTLMTQPVKRILGTGFDGKPIFAPRHSHALLLAAAGGGKTTCGAVPWLQSLVADTDTGRALVITDSKEGEIAAQCADMCAKAGRTVAIIDGFGVLDAHWGGTNPYTVSLNPMGAVVSSFVKANGELIFSTENANQALIEEPPRDQRNTYWRDEPRTLGEFCTCVLLKRNPRLATPGGVWSILSDPKLLLDMAQVEAEEGDDYLRALALHVLGMARNEEHFPQHRAAALKALRVYAASSPLHRAGVGATRTHEDLIRQKAVIFLVGPVRHMERLGADYALHLQSFMEVVLSGRAPPVTFILDEFTNAPLKALVSQLTTMRGYGGNCLMIAQSRSEIQRRYGDKETLTIEENAVVKQWFGFSSFEEAERVSHAIGEALAVSRALGIQSGQFGVSSNYSTAKERLFTAEELMRLPPDEQVIHVKDVGFIHCRKIRQNEIAPYCFDLAPNPLEGGLLAPDPKVWLEGGR